MENVSSSNSRAGNSCVMGCDGCFSSALARPVTHVARCSDKPPSVTNFGIPFEVGLRAYEVSHIANAMIAGRQCFHSATVWGLLIDRVLARIMWPLWV